MEEELEVIHKGLANAKNGFKAVPGKLYLTATNIVHKPNDYFDEEINIPLNRVAKIRGVRTKILGKELLSNILEIDMISGVKYQFVVNKQKKWLEAVSEVLESRGEAEKLG
ncbi:hypothetical protein ABE964_000715 [Listeria monocytogenes]|uniref:hypothetical protein n=1 Tax=Listeria monocytogenes TaxID=1639 RepID=UPI0011EAAE35|nr:hypothetical protein [Listeria monocytogenes]EAE7926012.1 hypothetical protein [Listeria monocytogenes]EAG3116591.1 hypothetical protein [Listeria monocytogenes]ECR3272435.1 hypothetical protein [Listeria monocytogenes]EHK2530238.1 hypothetical protein [Listeria monocytogenes]EIY8213912.1 hypothetical protein [Listeria monocytogenes]